MYPEKLSLSSAVELSMEAALINGMERINREQGELQWKQSIVNVLDIKLPEVNVEEVKASKNWVLNTIIHNKDSDLYGAMIKYMTEYEKEYTADKLELMMKK